MRRDLPGIGRATRTRGQLLDKELTGKVIDAFFFSYNVLGFGFYESVYRKALANELRSRGLHVVQEYAADVYYRDEVVGAFRTDLFVEHRLPVELKSTARLSAADMQHSQTS